MKNNNINLNTMKIGKDPRQSINSSDDCGVVTGYDASYDVMHGWEILSHEPFTFTEIQCVSFGINSILILLCCLGTPSCVILFNWMIKDVCCEYKMKRLNNRKNSQERHYGCYRLGAIIAVILIVVLIVGTVPVLFAIDNSKIILLVTCVMLSIVAILLFLSFGWQRRQVRQQRENFGREWVKTTKRQNNHYKSVPTSSHTSWRFWSNSNKDEVTVIQEKQDISRLNLQSTHTIV